MADKRTYNEKLADKHGVGRGNAVSNHVSRTTSSRDARHQGARDEKRDK